jgi:hypothetical protein
MEGPRHARRDVGPLVALSHRMSVPPVVVASSAQRSRVGPAVLGAIGALAAALVLPSVPLPHMHPDDLFRATRSGQSPRWRMVVGDVAGTLASPPSTSPFALGAWPHVLALGLASAGAGLVTAVRGRAVRTGGVWTWGALLVVGVAATAGFAGYAWVRDADRALPPGVGSALPAACLALVTLALTGAGVAVGHATRLSGMLVLVAAQLLGMLGLMLLYMAQAPYSLVYPPPFVGQVVGGAIALGGGLWLVRRHRLGRVDLSGLLGACPTPAEVALLPYAWSLWGGVALLLSSLGVRQIAPAVNYALRSNLGELLERIFLGALSVAALAWVLARRERRDRGAGAP